MFTSPTPPFGSAFTRPAALARGAWLVGALSLFGRAMAGPATFIPRAVFDRADGLTDGSGTA